MKQLLSNGFNVFKNRSIHYVAVDRVAAIVKGKDTILLEYQRVGSHHSVTERVRLGSTFVCRLGYNTVVGVGLNTFILLMFW